jgi:hypothetical protein
MEIQEVLRSQYLASLEMIEDAVRNCPDAQWDDPEAGNPFWHVAYHALFYAHLYLANGESDFRGRPYHRMNSQFLGTLPWPPHEKVEVGEPYGKDVVLDYAAFCEGYVAERLPVMDLAAPSRYSWVPFSTGELMIYNIRHIQHHAGQLADRLRRSADLGVAWIPAGGKKP